MLKVGWSRIPVRPALQKYKFCKEILGSNSRKEVSSYEDQGTSKQFKDTFDIYIQVRCNT